MRVGNRASEAALSAVLTLWLSCLLGGAAAASLPDALGSPVATPPAPVPSVGASPSGPGRARVRDIEVRLDATPGRPIDPRPLLAFRPGMALTEVAVRRTISNLHATGLFAQAEVLVRAAQPPDGAEPGGGWVTVVVVLRSHTWVESVELAGEIGLAERTLRRELRQQPQAPFEEELVLADVAALEELLGARGFRAARVSHSVEPPEGSRRRVIYHLESGPRAGVGTVRFSGDLGPFGRPELLEALRIREGIVYDRSRILADAERLRRWWVRRGYLTATVGEPEEHYDSERGAIDLSYPVTAGPHIEVEVSGAARRQLKKKGYLSFLEEGYDEAALEKSREDIETHYQKKGYFRAAVRAASQEADEARRLEIEIEPGPRYQLEEIRLEGNTQIPERELLPLMRTSVRRRLRPGSGHLVLEELDEDLANLRSYYLLQGFTEVEVGPAAIYEDGASLELRVPIREGPRRRVVDLTIAGIERFDARKIHSSLPLAPGGPFHPVLLEDSINIVRAFYEDDGFRAAGVEARLDWNDEGTLVDVHLEVSEGSQVLVDRVILRGQRRTREELVRRFIKLAPGEPVSRRRLLEVERDLYRLGIFSDIDVELAPVAEITDRRDVIVRLEEGRQWRLAYGFSYHSDEGLGGLFSLTRSNIGGRGDRLQLDLRGNEVDRRFRLIYDRPSIFGTTLPITFSIFRQDEVRESFAVDELGAQISLTKDFRRVRLGLAYEYRLVDLEETPIDPGDLDREIRDVEIASFIPHLFVDHRDDALDPQRGWSTSVQLEAAVPMLSADVSFLKLFVQQTHYQPLGPVGVLASSLRLGGIEPLDATGELDPGVPPELPSALVPVSERFFAGGRTTHRAYERDQLGIPGETLIGDDLIEVGGNGLFILNLDYRFPLFGPVGGNLFVDVGNVWADWRNLDPEDFAYGAGLGIRYASPVGPLRLEVGWKLDREPGQESPVFFLSFGNPF